MAPGERRWGRVGTGWGEYDRCIHGKYKKGKTLIELSSGHLQYGESMTPFRWQGTTPCLPTTPLTTSLYTQEYKNTL